MAKMVNFLLCVFYHNFKKEKETLKKLWEMCPSDLGIMGVVVHPFLLPVHGLCRDHGCEDRA